MNEELTMFERLLTLPLFQGMTLNDLSEVLAHVRLDFVNYQAGDEIVVQNDPCKNLICVINGSITSTMHDPEGRFSVTEKLAKVSIIEPYNMFGMFQKYSRDYSFDTDGVTLSIERHVFINHVMNNNIVKINMMNIICNRYQQTLKVLSDFSTISVASKVVKFFQTCATEQKGEKKIDIKMVDLANILQETRLRVSMALNMMRDNGLIILQRGSIIIPALEELRSVR